MSYGYKSTYFLASRRVVYDACYCQMPPHGLPETEKWQIKVSILIRPLKLSFTDRSLPRYRHHRINVQFLRRIFIFSLFCRDEGPFFSSSLRPNRFWGSTQPAILWVLGIIFPGVKLVRESDTHLHLESMLMCRAIPPFPHTSSWRDA